MNKGFSLVLFALFFLTPGLAPSCSSSIETFISSYDGTIEKVYVKNYSYVGPGEKILKISGPKTPRITLRSFRGGYISHLEVQEKSRVRRGEKLFIRMQTPPVDPNVPCKVSEEDKADWAPSGPRVKTLQVFNNRLILEQSWLSLQSPPLQFPLTLILSPLLNISVPVRLFENSLHDFKMLEGEQMDILPSSIPVLKVEEEKPVAPPLSAVYQSMRSSVQGIPMNPLDSLGFSVSEEPFYHTVFWMIFEAFLMFLALTLLDVWSWEWREKTQRFARAFSRKNAHSFWFFSPQSSPIKVL